MYNGTSNFNLTKYNLKNITPFAAMCVIGSRGSGKSILIRDMLYQHRDITTVIIAPTDRMNGFYSEFVPSLYVHYEYSSELLTKIFKRQMDLIEKNKQRVAAGKKSIDDRLFLVMDDCLASKAAWEKDPNINEMLMNGRHYHIYFVLCLQFALGINPSTRSNLDAIFLLGEDFISNQKRLYDHYCGMFPSFDIFKRVFLKVTNNFGVMVINNRKKGGLINEKVFWYKANMTPQFTIGNKKYLEFHKNFFNKNWNKVKKEFDVDDYLNKKQKLNIDIKLNRE
jgi:hypothetical protein